MKKLIDEITATVTTKFRTFGGGRDSQFNPLTHYLKDQPPQFAAGVDVREVVAYIVKAAAKAK